jgi:hypothetical protein
MVLPMIKALVESKVVPALKRWSYENFDNKATSMVEKLISLKEKIDKEENSIKKMAHIEGYKLGVATLRAIGLKLVKSADALDLEV